MEYMWLWLVTFGTTVLSEAVDPNFIGSFFRFNLARSDN